MHGLHRSQNDRIECQAAFAEDRAVLYSDRDFLNRLNATIDQELDQREYLSLDVFDTLLLRGNESELRRFVEVGRRFSEIAGMFPGVRSPCGPADGFVARMMGNQASYRLRPLVEGKCEGSLEEILSISANMFVGEGAEKLAGQFWSAELEFEAKHLKVSQFWLDRIKRHRAAGGKCILITDMYMHASDVRKLLDLLTFPEEFINHITSSADTGVTKASGKFFELVEKRLNTGSDNFFHVGDSFVGDYLRPRRAGWRALHLPVPVAELKQRVTDHAETASQLKREHNLATNVAWPGDGSFI